MEDPTKKEEIMDNKNEKDSKPALPTRSYVVMALAGAYVAYLGFSLCKVFWMELREAIRDLW